MQSTSPSVKESQTSPASDVASVPTVRVRLLQTVRLLPHRGTTVTVQVEGHNGWNDSRTQLLEPGRDSVLQVPESLIHVQKDYYSVQI